MCVCTCLHIPFEAKKCFIFAIALSKLHLSWQFSAHNNFNKFPVICNRYFSYNRIRRTSLKSRVSQRTVHAVAQPSSSSITRRRTSTIAPNLWLPSISDFYYVNYRISVVPQERVYWNSIQDVDELRRHLNDGWSSIQQTSLIKQLISDDLGWGYK